MTSQVMADDHDGGYSAAMDSRVPTHRSTSTALRADLGALLRQWRSLRRLSQLDLALEAGTSTRHLSCIETGKSQPSRDMVMRLADTLQIPLRERNALLMAAGYAPHYPETALAEPQLAKVRHAIDSILQQQEPYPAFVLNRRWDVLMANRAALRINRYVLGGDGSTHDNMVRQFFDPADLRRAVVNWEEVAGDLIHHLHNEVAAAPSDAVAHALLREVLAYPGVPERWHARELGADAPPLLTVVFRRGDRELRFFSTISVFGTPRDVTLDELRMECVFPGDEATAALCRQLADEEANGGTAIDE